MIIKPTNPKKSWNEEQKQIALITSFYLILERTSNLETKNSLHDHFIRQFICNLVHIYHL